MVWRVVISQIATYSEIDRHWSILDLMDANDALDWKILVEKKSQEANKVK